MVKDQKGVREWLRVEQSAAQSTRGDMECDAYISRLGVRHKPPEITTDYKPVKESPEITGFVAVSSPLPPAAIHQHKSESDLKHRNYPPVTTEHGMQCCIS